MFEHLLSPESRLANVTVDAVDVIHTRYISQGLLWPRALVASAAYYLNQESTSTADTSKGVSNFLFSNWRCEGICPALFGFNPLENIDTMVFRNIWIEKFHPRPMLVGTSTLRVFTDGSGKPITLGQNSPNQLGLIIENFKVGDVHISKANDNWRDYQEGRLNVDGHWHNRWTVR